MILIKVEVQPLSFKDLKSKNPEVAVPKGFVSRKGFSKQIVVERNGPSNRFVPQVFRAS